MLLFYYIFIIGSWFSYQTTIVPPPHLIGSLSVHLDWSLVGPLWSRIRDLNSGPLHYE